MCISRLKSIITGKSRQELQIASHSTSVVKNREKCMHACCVQLDLSTVTEVRMLCLGNDTAHSGLDLPPSVNLRQTPTDMPTDQPNVDDDPSLRLSGNSRLGQLDI